MFMSKTSSIKSIFEDKKKIFSVEFFPPKDEAGGERMLNTASLIQPHKPDFVSITYGAGGGTRSTTMRYAKILREEHGFEVMPHLTCVGHTRDELLEILEDFAEAGFGNVMALARRSAQGRERIPDCSRWAVLWLRPRFSHSRKLSRFWNRSGRLP